MLYATFKTQVDTSSIIIDEDSDDGFDEGHEDHAEVE